METIKPNVGEQMLIKEKLKNPQIYPLIIGKFL